jgi:hypothetical protein
VRVKGQAIGAQPLERIEIVVNGEVARSVKPQNRKTAAGGLQTDIDEAIALAGSSWLAVRCYEPRPGGRLRFAHTGPFHFDVANKPLRPRQVEVEYLVTRVEEQLRRSGPLLPPAAQQEYRDALKVYRDLLQGARQ